MIIFDKDDECVIIDIKTDRAISLNHTISETIRKYFFDKSTAYFPKFKDYEFKEHYDKWIEWDTIFSININGIITGDWSV